MHCIQVPALILRERKFSIPQPLQIVPPSPARVRIRTVDWSVYEVGRVLAYFTALRLRMFRGGCPCGWS